MALGKKRLVVANWKMYVPTLERARALAEALKRSKKKFADAEVWLAAPAPFIPAVARALGSSTMRAGAQTASSFAEGPHTGEVSAAMLRDAGAYFALVGHSERRAMGHSDEQVREALVLALAGGLRAVLCVGEHARDEQGGHFGFLETQLFSALGGLRKADLGKMVIAYEPVWAIGRRAEEAARPEVVREVAIFLRKLLSERFGRDAGLRVPVLYGGSVDGSNAAALIESADINGFLVGRASAHAAAFLAIIAACA